MAKDALKVGDRELGELIGVNFSTVARWLRDETLPTENSLPRVKKALEVLHVRMQQSCNATSNDSLPIKIKNSTEQNATKSSAPESNNVVRKESKKTKASSTGALKVSARAKPTKKTKSIDRDNPCASCSALKTKAVRFVDGEGARDGLGGHVYITL